MAALNFLQCYSSRCKIPLDLFFDCVQGVSKYARDIPKLTMGLNMLGVRQAAV